MNTNADLAAANHILYDQGILDGFGHVSMRDPARSDRFLLSRNRAPVLVQPADILQFDFEGTVIAEDNPSVYVERFLHAAIYAVRPDVAAVVHSHAPSVLPFGAVGSAELCPICHMSGFIRRNSPIFEIRDFAGTSSDMLVRSLDLGHRLAEVLGDHALVLMRGHGMTVVGNTLKQAVFRAIYTEANARAQLAALQLGTPTYLTEDEAAGADAVNSAQVDRAWAFWEKRAAASTAIFREG